MGQNVEPKVVKFEFQKCAKSRQMSEPIKRQSVPWPVNLSEWSICVEGPAL